MMKLKSLVYVALVASVFGAAGCGEPAAKPTTKDDVTKFQGDPKSPALQNALKAGFGAAPKPGGPPATTPATTGG